MTKLTGGQAIVKSLVTQGVDTIFGLPGVQNDYLYNALYDEQDKIRVIHTRHEQGAAYMALGYALSSNRAGVYNVVPGPGFLNTTAALSTAYACNAKVLCLTGQITSTHIGRGIGFLHEIPDQLGILRSLTKWAARIDSPAEAPVLVSEAFTQMMSGRPRPAGLEVAMDVLSRNNEVDLTPIRAKSRRPPVDAEAIDQAAQLLGQAKNPLIFVGSGAAEAAEEVKLLAEALQAPVISSFSGRGVLTSRHYLSHPLPVGYHLLEKADALLAVGTRLQFPLMYWGLPRELKVVRVDIDPTEPNRVTPPAVALVAHCRDALQTLVPAIEKYNRVRPSREEEMKAITAEVDEQLAFLEPQRTFLKVIREALPDDGIFVDEVTQIGYVSRLMLPCYQPYTHITPGYQGTLGYGFATALGVKVANPDKPVLAVAGDGGFMFTVQELATAVQHKIGLVTLVFNDDAYGNVRRMQKNQYGNRVIASDLHNPDFVKLAESFGAHGLRVEQPGELRQAIERGFAADGPTIIEIPVGEMPDPWPLLLRRRS